MAHTFNTTANSELATYSVNFSAVPTAAVDLVSALAGGGKVLRLRRLILNPGLQTTAANVNVVIGNAGAAQGTGGSAFVPAPTDPRDAAASSTFRTGDTTVAASIVTNPAFTVAVFVSTAASGAQREIIFGNNGQKCPTATATACLVIRHPGVTGGSGFVGTAEFTEETA
jgi:hypothetical protein